MNKDESWFKIVYEEIPSKDNEDRLQHAYGMVFSEIEKMLQKNKNNYE